MIDELAEAKLRHPSSGVLQEVIATNAVRAFNQGFERGETSERERIIELIEATYSHNEEPYCYRCDYITLIKGE